MLNQSIKDIGERELIKRISSYMPNNQTSDDCAYLKTHNKNFLISTDLMVENTHFNNKIISPKDLGWKAVATNYSDLSSSGCIENIGINIGLVLTPETSWGWVKDLYDGFSEALNKFGGLILGGDISKGEKKTISITAIGIQSKLKLRKNACRPGEVLLTSGIHGLSKIGYLLQSKQIIQGDLKLSQKIIDESIKAFCRPEPKYETLKQIIYSQEDFKIKEVGCTDSSDGLYEAILGLARESNCKALVDYQKIPKYKKWPKGIQWDEYYFFGGEDYELVFSLPKNWAKKLLLLDRNTKEIGYFEEGIPSLEILNYPQIDLLKNNTYSHF